MSRARARSAQDDQPSLREEARPAAKASASDSIPIGPLRLSGIVKTTNGFAVASVELSVEEWEFVTTKSIGASQRFKEYIALEHKRMVSALGQK